MINNFVVIIGSVSVHEITDSDTEGDDSLSNLTPPIRTASTAGTLASIRTASTAGTSASVSVTTGSTSGTQHNRASGI